MDRKKRRFKRSRGALEISKAKKGYSSVFRSSWYSKLFRFLRLERRKKLIYGKS